MRLAMGRDAALDAQLLSIFPAGDAEGAVASLERFLAALGVSAHEAGHAIQHKVGYKMMSFRQTLVPMTQIASGIANFVLIFGIWIFAYMRGGTMLLTIGAAALAIVCLFQLVTLPVEFDASRRALAQLTANGAIMPQEVAGAKQVLDAAALTYVAAAAMAALQLIRLLLIRDSRR